MLDDGGGQLCGDSCGPVCQQHTARLVARSPSLLLASVYLHAGFQVRRQDARRLEIGYRLFK